MGRLGKQELINDFIKIGIKKGDLILVRASLGAVGKITGGAKTFIDALKEVVGNEGTIVSLAFTDASFIKKPKKENAFVITKKSYAGSLPNAMIEQPEAHRSRHPMCSYVAIGRLAEEITHDHDETSQAYEPIRKIIQHNGKNLLIGCVDSSPGFTTAHLAEADLGYLKKFPIFPSLIRTYYVDREGELKIFHRTDPGLCSNSFDKFYSLYVSAGILSTGHVGKAYSIMASAESCYKIEFETLRKDKKFNICDSNICWTCNAGRWDRIHRIPGFLLRKYLK